MRRYPRVLVCFLLLTVVGPSRAQRTVTEEVTFCELIAAPEKYDGVRISTFAVYNYGFERQELVCPECRIVGKLTWAEFSVEYDKQLRKQLRKAPKENGVIAARFTGVFRRRSFDGFSSKFEVQEVSGLRVLVRDFKTPFSSVPSCSKLLETDSKGKKSR